MSTALRVTRGVTALSRSWINQHKPATPSHNHGGFLFGLGLSGSLSQLMTPDIYDLLQQGHDGTTIGVLLGLAVANRGSADVGVSKMLRLHIPAVLPTSLSELDVAPMVQAVSTLGLGLLYQGTSNRMFTEYLLDQVGGRPVSERLDDRDAYCLSAGFALGMVTLGRGGSLVDASLHDLFIESRLQRYLNGGRNDAVSTSAAAAASAADPARTCRIREGDDVNVSVTSAGAVVALGLMYLQTNNDAVARILAPPATMFGLDGVRSDVLLMRVTCQSLVMWDAVDGTPQWLQSCIPDTVSDVFTRMLSRARKDNMTVAELLASADSGDADGDADANASTADPFAAHDALIDAASVKEYHALCLAGGCLAIGLRYAGTADASARQTLLSTLSYFRCLRAVFPDDEGKAGECPDVGCPVAEQLRPSIAARVAPDRFCTEMCVSTVALALSLVMAGTGDVAAFRMLRDLRARCDRAVSYGALLTTPEPMLRLYVW